MPHPVPALGYVAVLRIPGVLRPFTAVNLGRLSYAAMPLSILITVQQATASFTSAGITLGVLSAATGLMPFKSRLIDRLGARRVLPILAALFTAALLTIAVVASAGASTTVLYLVLAGAAGAATPPLGPSMRALWAALTPDPAARQRAYALDGVAEEFIFVLGPLVVAAALVVFSAPAALVVVGILNVVGAVGLAFSRVAPTAEAAPTPGRSAPIAGPLRERGFVTLVLVMLGIGVGGAQLEVAIVARAQELSAPETAAYLLAALSVGSALGGLLWGVRKHRRAASTQLAGLVLVMSVGSVAAGNAPQLVLLGMILLLAGLANAPAQIVAYLAADRLVSAGSRTEATTWISTAGNIGASLGVSAAAVLVDHLGAMAAATAGGLVLIIVAPAVLIARDRLNSGTHVTPNRDPEPAHQPRTELESPRE
jgi:MFS family permease